MATKLVFVEGEDRACTKGEPHKKSKCRIKLNLDATNFQPNKSTTQIWVLTHHHYEFLGSFFGFHVGGGGRGVRGGGGKPVVALRNIGSFIP